MHLDYYLYLKLTRTEVVLILFQFLFCWKNYEENLVAVNVYECFYYGNWHIYINGVASIIEAADSFVYFCMNGRELEWFLNKNRLKNSLI